jgi:hypothetical protein
LVSQDQSEKSFNAGYILGFKLKQKLEKAEKFCSDPLFTPHPIESLHRKLCTMYLLHMFAALSIDSGIERTPQILIFVLQICTTIYSPEPAGAKDKHDVEFDTGLSSHP